MVERRRIELLTPCVQSRCSPSWANTPSVYINSMVGLNGLEPTTSPLSGVRSNHLSYRPMSIELLNYNIIALPSCQQKIYFFLQTGIMRWNCSPATKQGSFQMPFSMDPQIGESACTELSEWKAAFPFSPSSRFTPCIFIPISLYKYILHCFFTKQTVPLFISIGCAILMIRHHTRV